MTVFNYVRNDFGQGVIIPIPKGEGKLLHNKSEDYRGITVSPVISKVYELGLAQFLNKYLYSSERQMGFKKGVGCSNAIFSVREVVHYFTSNSSKVNICTVDLSKAFDRISYDIMFSKLIDRNVPRCVIEIIRDWYGKMLSAVK